MKRFLIAALLCLAFSANGLAQQTPDQNPASKEDVERYLDVVHSHEMMKQMMEAMVKPMHQMVHDEYLKDKDKLPADFEAETNKFMDDMFRNMPMDDMMQAMVPVYQKHFTKGDIDALVVFYSSPTGQKVLREMPAIVAESMQTMMPIMRTYVEGMQARLQQQIAEALKKPQTPPAQDPPSRQN